MSGFAELLTTPHLVWGPGGRSGVLASGAAALPPQAATASVAERRSRRGSTGIEASDLHRLSPVKGGRRRVARPPRACDPSRVDPSRDLAAVRRLVLEALRGARADVYLFGSHARGAAHRTSDVDVAVLPIDPLPLGTLAVLRERLEEAPIVARVDIVDLSQVSPAFRAAVLQEGVPWSEPTNA
jgi:uncharacterized protein